MLPGKSYKIDDFVEMAWRRRWLVVLPFILSTVVGFAYSQFLPDRFESEALILIVPQRVPTNLVQTTVSSTLNERLNSISAQILSRTRLERIINELGLYADERETELMEDVVEQMRRDIDISIPRARRRDQPDSFRVGFEADDRQIAMQVAQRLASLFIQENLEQRELQADATTRFLESQLEEARRGLLEHEQRLEAYRQRNAGQLPSQLGSNLQVLQSTETQVRSLIDASDRLLDRKTMLERLVSDASSQLTLRLNQPLELEQLSPDAPAALRLEVARAALRNLELRLQPEHPDVIAAKQVIAELEQKAEAEALAQPLVPDGSTRGTTAARSPLEDQLASYQLELATIERQLTTNGAKLAELQQMSRQYQARIDSTPERESELAELMRDYTTLQANYTALLQKNEQAKIALNLERRQIGEQFRMLDAPRLPQRPISPDRSRIALLSAAIGLGIGAGFGLLLEYRDASLRTMDDVVMSLSLPVLATVPLMTSERERHQQRVVRWVTTCTLLIAIVGLGAAAWRLGFVDQLLEGLL